MARKMVDIKKDIDERLFYDLEPPDYMNATRSFTDHNMRNEGVVGFHRLMPYPDDEAWNDMGAPPDGWHPEECNNTSSGTIQRINNQDYLVEPLQRYHGEPQNYTVNITEDMTEDEARDNLCRAKGCSYHNPLTKNCTPRRNLPPLDNLRHEYLTGETNGTFTGSNDEFEAAVDIRKDVANWWRWDDKREHLYMPPDDPDRVPPGETPRPGGPGYLRHRQTVASRWNLNGGINIYSKITNPKTNRKININSKLGKKILRQYLSIL